MTERTPLVRAYLRASTDKQDADRARGALMVFASDHGRQIAGFYPEIESGAKLYRPELMRLLDDSQPGDVILVEQVDRLSRLTEQDWQKLRQIIADKGLHIVALDLPTSHQLMQGAGAGDFAARMLGAMNGMLLDMLAAIARKDYEDRRRRAQEGIRKAQKLGVYKGRPVDTELHARIKSCLSRDMGVRETARVLGCGKATVQRVKASYERDKGAAAG